MKARSLDPRPLRLTGVDDAWCAKAASIGARYRKKIMVAGAASGTVVEVEGFVRDDGQVDDTECGVVTGYRSKTSFLVYRTKAGATVVQQLRNA